MTCAFLSQVETLAGVAASCGERESIDRLSSQHAKLALTNETVTDLGAS